MLRCAVLRWLAFQAHKKKLPARPPCSAAPAPRARLRQRRPPCPGAGPPPAGPSCRPGTSSPAGPTCCEQKRGEGTSVPQHGSCWARDCKGGVWPGRARRRIPSHSIFRQARGNSAGTWARSSLQCGTAERSCGPRLPPSPPARSHLVPRRLRHLVQLLLGPLLLDLRSGRGGSGHRPGTTCKPSKR